MMDKIFGLYGLPLVNRISVIRSAILNDDQAVNKRQISEIEWKMANCTDLSMKHLFERRGPYLSMMANINPAGEILHHETSLHDSNILADSNIGVHIFSSILHL